MPGYRRCRIWVISLAIAVGLVIGAAGCSFGPKALERTHARYNESIRRVYEEQLLQNLVRLRYEEVPFRLNVQSIAAQYELAGSAEARPFFLAPNPSGTDLPEVHLDLARPPAQRRQSADHHIHPVEQRCQSDASSRRSTADTLVFLGSTSWPISTVMRLWVERMNGVPNAARASGPQREFVPDFARFQRVAHLMQVAQDLELMIITPQERSTPVGGPVAGGIDQRVRGRRTPPRTASPIARMGDGSWVLDPQGAGPSSWK